MFVYKQILFISLTIVCLSYAIDAANIMDVLEWSILGNESAELRAGEEAAAPGGQRNCICDGPSCICCIDFNVTFIDLGGPGCVRMKYLSQDEGFAINISYGNSLLHSRTVKGPDPEPICMNLLSKVAQLCARITELAPTGDGLRGCVLLEPTLLGEPTLEFPIGCFRSGADGMIMEPMKGKDNETDTTVVSTGPKPPGINAEELIEGVNQSVEEGFAFISDLLGFTFGNSTGTDEEEDAVSEDPKPAAEATSQAPVLEIVTPPAARGAKTMRFRSKLNEI